MTTGTGQIRYADLDALRACAMMGGIVLHGVIPYMVEPMPNLLWPVHDPSTWVGFDWLFWWLHAFRIPMFFVVAGFFAAMLIERRGANGFLGHRARRIAIPFGLALLTILPLTYAVFCWGWWLDDRVVWYEIVNVRFDDSWVRDQVRGPAHLWFLGDLFIFCVLAFAFVRLGFSRAWPGWLAPLLRGPIRVLFLSIPLVAIVILRPEVVYRFDNSFVPDPWRLLYHLPFFLVGTWWYAYRGELGRLAREWPWMLALGTIAFVPSVLLFTRTDPGSRVALAVASAVTAWAYSFGFMGLFGRFFAGPSRRWRYVSDASYWIYLVHLPLVAAAQVVLWPVSMPAPLKFLLAAGSTAIAGLLTYHLFVRYTFIGTTLNGPRTRPPESRSSERVTGRTSERVHDAPTA